IVGWVSEAWGPARGLQVLAVAAFGVALITVLSGRRGVGMGVGVGGGGGVGVRDGNGGGGGGGVALRPQGDGGRG
ncbi:MAG TPA: hypothetical protein VK773_10745, partial [Acidimicrobiales bacterium]|nr:hypothetical protein [Acidimicrobiales bacterium]